MAMLCHIGGLLGTFVPPGNLVVPLVIWMLKKDQSAFINEHGKEAINFQINLSVWAVICFVISFILLIAGTVQLAELVIRRRHALLHRLLGMYLPLITTNCAVLGVALLNAGTADSLAAALAMGLGAGLGFALVMLLFASLRERLESAEVPQAFRGPAIALVTAGMMSLAFLGFAGLIRV